MIEHIPSLTSLIDRCAHRAAMHLRTKTAPLNDSGPIVSFTFNDVPGKRFFGWRGNSRRPRSQRHILHRRGALQHRRPRRPTPHIFAGMPGATSPRS